MRFDGVGNPSPPINSMGSTNRLSNVLQHGGRTQRFRVGGPRPDERTTAESASVVNVRGMDLRTLPDQRLDPVGNGGKETDRSRVGRHY